MVFSTNLSSVEVSTTMEEDAEVVDVAEVDETSANPFVCNVCKRSYSRIDHLARHYRSREVALSQSPVLLC